MKKFQIVLASFLLMMLLAAGCGQDESEQSVKNNETDTTNEEWKDMASELDNVTGTLTELKANIEDPENIEQIHATGKSLEEHWDTIEGQVEEQYPDDYTTIEESLYPLINETKKEQPDAEKISSLIDETNAKLTEFLKKAETPKRDENGIDN
ncbi:hypothetical protein [Domibacillus epiphyticus]|uniref:Lipoprotein n=1 Tax=Domibacillus epiphyticus TaxID=1714355 RepID=A0A1V2ABQ0_9BACI|nr:hypothetical protein [Domibacillus epiphyticus]OMP68387.1 hypothetical protein BTO28_01845 [Domibacillus epiphyticus]